MIRIIGYRGFEIHVYLSQCAEDLFEVAFQIKDRSILRGPGKPASRITLRNGPFTRRWSYLMAECAGQAAIDLLLEGAP